MKPKPSVAPRLAWAALPALLVLFGFVVPIATVLAYGFGVVGSGRFLPTLAHLLATPYYRNRIVFTFEQATLSTLLILAIGLPLAYVFAFHDFPLKRLLRALFTAPFVLPALVVAISLQAFLGPGGTLEGLTGIDVLGGVGPLGAILVAHVFYDLSLVIRIVGASWSQVPDAFPEAARTLGASRGQVARRILLPLARPAILSAAALVFLFTLSSFGVILLLGGPRTGTLETLIYEEAQSFLPHYDVAATLGVLQLATTIVAIMLYVHFERRSTTPFRSRDAVPRPHPSPLAWATLVPAGVFFAMPIGSLAWSSLHYHGRLSLEGYRLLADQAHPLGAYTIAQAATHSLLFGGVTVLLSVPLAMATAYAFRRSSGGAALLESGLLAPLGLSSVLLGLGLLLAYDGSPLWDLRTHPLRIIIAHTLIAFPFVTRVLSPSLDAIDPSLRHAARTLGANPRQVITRIEIPLLAPALRVAATYAFATSLGEFGATLLLRSANTVTIPLAIYDAFGRIGEPFRAQAQALSVILVAVALLSFLAFDSLRRPQEATPR